MSEIDLLELHAIAKTIAASIEDRNRLILQARIDGWPWSTIAEATGLTVNGVEKIATKANGGKRPIPKRMQKPSFN